MTEKVRPGRAGAQQDDGAPSPSSDRPDLPLSVYMITFNNGSTVERALASVSGWAGEIVVVDSESSDGSQPVMERYAHIFQHYLTRNLRDKYQRAQDLCTKPWVLFIDADEWLTLDIKDEISRILVEGTSCDGFSILRRNRFLGREIRFGAWHSDAEIRLYRRDRGHWEGGIHARVYVDGRIGKLKNWYLHTPYSGISHQTEKLNYYSEAIARDLSTTSRRPSRFSLVARPLFRFFKDYVLRRGFLDGVPGLVIAVADMHYVFMKYAKLWELEKVAKKGRTTE